MKKTHVFNVVSGLIVLPIEVFSILQRYKLLSYILIILFFIFYYLQVKKIHKRKAFVGNIIIPIYSLWTLLPFLFAP